MSKKQKKTKQEKRRLKAIKQAENTRQLLDASRENLLERAIEKRSAKGQRVEVDHSNPIKMSEVILEYSKPLFDAARTAQDQRRAIELAILLWNLSMLPKEAQEKNLHELRSKFCGEDQAALEEMDQVLFHMLARRKVLYNNIPRFISDYEIIELSERFHLNVVSITLKNNPA